MALTYKLALHAPESSAPLIAGLLGEGDAAAGAVCWSRSPDGGWRIEAYYPQAPDLQRLQAELSLLLDGSGAIPAVKLEEVPEEDWVARAQRDLKPVQAGRFFIHGGHDRHKARGRFTAIEIDAGRAFGTAHHGTTKACLIAIGEIARIYPIRRVLDLGAGSGILAIAAAKLTGASVLATDIDPVAVRIARANCLRNGVAARVAVAAADGMAHPEIMRRAPFDLLTANLLAEPLLRLAAAVRGVLRRGGLAVLSGLLDTQAAEVLGHYRATGFQLRKRISLEGWTTLILVRR